MAWTGETTDEDLFAAYRGGDQGAFVLLFRRYQGPLGRHLERMMDDRAAAEDLVVETFQRLHVHRDRLRDGAAIRPWVYTIARNLARNRHRRTRLARWLPLDVLDAARPASDPRPPGAEADHVGEHLAQCADCRETLAALELVWRTESGARPDLWGRVTARLASEPRPARFQLPADEWRRAALAAAILISVSWLVPGARAVTTLMLFGVG